MTNFTRICVLFTLFVISLGVHVGAMFGLRASFENKGDWFVVFILVFLFDVIFPVIAIYMMLWRMGVIG